MKYVGFFFSLTLTLLVAVGLSINLAGLPPLVGVFDPFQGFWQNTYSEDRNPQESLELEGLTAPVEVSYDAHLVPHLFAENETDLFRAQGYVTAAHRLWQMEFQVRAAEGRLSEVVGEMALPYDREMRRKGLAFGAETKLAFLERTDPELIALMQAYAEGVNAYITQLDPGKLPIEYKLLDYRPEPWSPYKSLVFLMNMAETLSGDSDFAYTNFRNLFGESWMQNLFPEYPEGVVPVVSKERWGFRAGSPRPPRLSYPDSDLISKALPGKEPGYGSNNWAVSGSKTASGNPILANDPHLALNLPSLWYAIQLSTPEFSVKGGSLPGALGVVIGFNEHMAWGLTNADRDVKDWYKITFKDSSRKEYLYNGQWIQSTTQLETIGIKGQSDYIDTVIYTHYGPVVYDKNFMTEKKPVDFALKWTAFEPSNEQRTFIQLNKGRNHADFLEAISSYVAPAQNFAFAAADGDIAMAVQGKFPIKWRGQGKYLMDGSNPDFEWKGWIPDAHQLREMNPERGFVQSANQHSASDNYPYYVFADAYEYHRNRRIDQRLSEMEDITVEHMMELQVDNFDMHASETLPFLLESLDSSHYTAPNLKWIEKLQAWEYQANPDLAAPALFTSWWRHLESELYGSWDSKGLPIVYPAKYVLSSLLQTAPAAPWFDNPATEEQETATHWVNAGFEAMIQEMEAREVLPDSLNWATYKGTVIAHLIPNFRAFSQKDLLVGGGRNIVNATSDDWGPGWRMVVEMGEPIQAYGVYPGGQSGNPGSRFYANLVGKWASGEYLRIDLRTASDREGILFKTTFKPD
ncbi:penicillin amidase [Cyclobacterium xiamenense]|uniref:Penicillin amidase n=1 Tax=Cyclobacterium xiamenense TaxID=1297121 RepID=A0A1H6ZL80_9BACT|nr:penicillin acylase family protein [Cyclobacterium xiamenense]SEJ50340.1 penicillin amidase [Cyclobacterium xiamenense]